MWHQVDVGQRSLEIEIREMEDKTDQILGITT